VVVAVGVIDGGIKDGDTEGVTLKDSDNEGVKLGDGVIETDGVTEGVTIIGGVYTPPSNIVNL
jgi:hypothetical protein